MPTPGSHAPYLTGRICPGYLVPRPPSPPLICSWSLLGPCPEGSSHRPPEGQEGAGGGLFLGEFSKPSGEAPGHTVFADLALQLTSTGLVTVTAIYSYCHLWVLSHERLGQNLALQVGEVCWELFPSSARQVSTSSA